MPGPAEGEAEFLAFNEVLSVTARKFYYTLRNPSASIARPDPSIKGATSGLRTAHRPVEPAWACTEAYSAASGLTGLTLLPTDRGSFGGSRLGPCPVALASPANSVWCCRGGRRYGVAAPASLGATVVGEGSCGPPACNSSGARQMTGSRTTNLRRVGSRGPTRLFFSVAQVPLSGPAALQKRFLEHPRSVPGPMAVRTKRTGKAATPESGSCATGSGFLRFLPAPCIPLTPSLKVWKRRNSRERELRYKCVVSLARRFR